MLLETIAASVLPGLVKETLNPLIKKTVNSTLHGIKNLSPHIMDLFTYRFSEFVACQTERHKYLNTLVFNNQKKLLEEIYIPLTLKTEVNVLNKIKELELKISNFNMDFLPVFNRVLITDTAGMGKSTLLRFLLLECIKSEYAIPIFIELRILSRNQTISDVIYNQLNLLSKKNTDENNPELSRKYIEKILKSGDFIFFLDGYDEIPFKDREFVTTSINEFISKNSKNIFVISSRPESGLAAFPGFHRFNIRPLVKAESYSLIKKYDQDGDKSNQLIEKLENKEYKGIEEYLKNPLLTTLLYRCYEYKQNLPLKKHVFYRQVFDALYDWHDATKDGYNTREKKSKLDLDSFHRVLRVIGFISVMQGKVEADTDLILNWIREAKKICSDLKFPESDFLEDSVKAVPVLIKDGNLYRWSHKSLAEYFAAQFLCTEGKDQQNKVLETIFESNDLEKFSNVLDQIYDIEPSVFKKHFIAPLAMEFRNYWSTSYKNLDPKIPTNIVALRKSATFDADFYIGCKLPQPKDFDNLFENLTIELLNGSKSKKLHQIFIVQVKDNNPIIGAKSIGKYGAILNILAGKKDPLVIPKHKIDLKAIKNKVTHIPRKGFAKIDDSETSKFNSFNNFASVTKLIITNNWVLDHEKLLNFTDDESETKIANLADSLLKDLIKSPNN